MDCGPAINEVQRRCDLFLLRISKSVRSETVNTVFGSGTGAYRTACVAPVGTCVAEPTMLPNASTPKAVDRSPEP